MAAIWNDIQITWKDEDYIITPTMEFLNFLEQGDGCSLSKMFIRMTKQDLPSSSACLLISRALTFAGCATTSEQVFVETGGGFGVEAVTLASAILVGCMPAPKESKKKPVKKATTKKL